MKKNKFQIYFLTTVIIVLIFVTTGVFSVKESQFLSNRFIKMNINFASGLLSRIFSLAPKFTAQGFANILNFSFTPRPEEKNYGRSVLVLAYNGVGDNTVNSVPEAKFREQMYYLKDNGYNAITMTDFQDFMAGNRTLPEKPVLITFDEGRKDNFYPVDPLLKILNFKAAIFINPDRVAEIDNQFYLSKKELAYMNGSSRWDIGLQGRNDREYSTIGANGEKGYSVSNLLWLEDEKRLETAEEYKARINSDLSGSKNKLGQLLGREVSAMAIPYGHFGENSINFKNSLDYFNEVAGGLFNTVFSKHWPKNNSNYRANYPLADSLKSAKRIIISPELSLADFEAMLRSARDLSLPFEDRSDNRNKWVTISGEADFNDDSFTLSGTDGSAGMYLDGSFLWNNYDYEIELGNISSLATTVSLLAGYGDSRSYLSCQFSKNAVTIKKFTPDGGLVILGSADTRFEYFNQPNAKLRLELTAGGIKCFINDKSVTQTKLSEVVKNGGVGLKIWDPVEKNISARFKALKVSNITGTSDSLCNSAGIKIAVADGVLCRLPHPGSEWLKIFDKYPLSLNGREVIYSFVDGGDIDIADAMIENKYAVSRFEAVKIEKINWDEDPFGDIYWRFNFYNLEPARQLLNAWQKTGDPVYKTKLLEFVGSFLDNGMDGKYSWDYHGTAFRTLTLVDIWWKLREKNELPVDLGVKILGALKRHGDFLADSEHFEKEYNHGLDQATALFLLARTFPDLPGALNWLALSKQRLDGIIADIIDNDGVLVENSPYYHFYVLEKFWEIRSYFEKNNLPVSRILSDKINKMISYATYVMMPDLEIPTIGASLGRQVNFDKIKQEIAASYPEFLYAISQGAQGTRPKYLNIQYPDSGQTIMRSSWSVAGIYKNQTQLIMDVGDYRTDHSDLDALSFNLYGNGLALMPDSGLYSYDAGDYRSYFHGTRAHNTVVVDGKDQDKGLRSGEVFDGVLKQGDGYAYQSGMHTLYDGVTHWRSIAMIEGKHIVIIDELASTNGQHEYEQMFHLFPGAKLDINGLTLKAQGATSAQSVTLKQLVADGVSVSYAIDRRDPIDGLCSVNYKETVPCYSVSYKQTGENISYITVIDIGSEISDVSLDGQNNIIMKTRTARYDIGVSKTKNIDRKITVNKKAQAVEAINSGTIIDATDNLSGWATPNRWSNILSIDDGEKDGEKSIKVAIPSEGTTVDVVKNIALDMSEKNIYFKVKASSVSDLYQMDVVLSNNNMARYAMYNIKDDIYSVDSTGEWLSIGLPKGDVRNIELGNWSYTGGDFDWSKIDGIRFRLQSKAGKTVTFNISSISLVPGQKTAKAVLMFDDGWSSVLDAVKIMEKYGLKGTVGVIANSVDTRNYLSVDDLKYLQNNLGWNVANHSSTHHNAIDAYYVTGDTKGFEEDIVDGLEFLQENGINSAPNWFIYPSGRTNDQIKQIVNKYYKFARATNNAPEAYPFADPMAVKMFSVYSDRTTPEDLHNAVKDAIDNNQTLLMMFHKFTTAAPPELYTENNLVMFEDMIRDIKDQGIRVVTLSELDSENNAPLTNFIIGDSVPSQIDLQITSSGATR